MKVFDVKENIIQYYVYTYRHSFKFDLCYATLALVRFQIHYDDDTWVVDLHTHQIYESFCN